MRPTASSFPVPVSPVIRTLQSVAATLSRYDRSSWVAWLAPTIRSVAALRGVSTVLPALSNPARASTSSPAPPGYTRRSLIPARSDATAKPVVISKTTSISGIFRFARRISEAVGMS
jgi:hypothetical protein